MFLFVVLICISLRTAIYVGLHMLVCHLYIFGEGFDQNFAYQNFLLCCWVLRVFCIFFILVLYQNYLLQIFSSVSGLSSHLLGTVFHRAEVLILMRSSLLCFFLFSPWIVPLVLYVRSHCQGFPGGLVVRTLYFHCTGYGFDPWLGN